MNITIVGAGVVGVTSAYFLAKAGFHVSVIEREHKPAMECSFANGAQLSYSHAEPWGSFPNVAKAIKWLGKKDAPLLFNKKLDIDTVSWIMRFLINCFHNKYNKNAKALLAINFYSRAVLHELLEEINFDFNYSTSGILHVFKHSQDLLDCALYFKKLQSWNNDLQFENLKRKDVVALDPALEKLMKYRNGAILCPQDELGDIHKFTSHLEEKCKELGVKFFYGESAVSLEVSNSRISHLLTNKREVKTDLYLICAGAYTSKLLDPIGINTHIYPMKGYSISIPIAQEAAAPKISVTDHEKKIVVATIGNVLRLAGTAEFAGYNHVVYEPRVKPLKKLASRYFPSAGDIDAASTWACLRPQTPRSYPIISKTDMSNLYINSGHGSLGWTQSLGCAKLIADIISRKKTDIDYHPYSIRRA
jgi:D-amino-acid dehydrogenase